MYASKPAVSGPDSGEAAVPTSEEEGRFGTGLGLRIFLGTATTLCVALAAANLVTTRQAHEAARARAVRDLEKAPALCRAYLDAQSAGRQALVRAAARESIVQSLLAKSGATPAAYHDRAMELAGRLGADRVFLFDAQGILRAGADRASGEAPFPDPVAAPAAFLRVEGAGGLALVVATPVTQGAGEDGKRIGVLGAAFPFDDARVGEIGDLASADVALFVNVAPRGSAPSVRLTAATPGLRDLDLPLGWKGSAALGPTELTSQGRQFIATMVPVRSSEGEPVATLLLARSPDAAAGDLRRLRRSLLIVGGLLVLLSLPLSLLLSAYLARPFRQLARVAEEIGRGQFDVEVPQLKGEMGRLSRAFASMVAELRAKAELEAVLAGDPHGRGTGAASGQMETQDAEGIPIVGTFAGRYEVLSVLGEGGMGTVYKVRDRELDDEVALKVLKPISGEGAGATPGSPGPTGELLRQEIKLARMVTHANVVRVHDFGEAEGVRYFTMEYVPGTTLRELLGRQPVLDLVPTLQIAKQICRGLAAVHRAGIVHGDLKPQNVVVMGNGVVKLMDFGVARTRSALAHGAPLAGTPAYMSPEQARGAELDERSDLYSAGVLFFELFTGRCPFIGGDPYETMRMHLDEAAPDPRKVRSDLPDALAQILSLCLDKSRFRRPASAADLERLLIRVRL